MPISVYDYTDYRKYLQDYYTERKSSSPIFSYRYFARRAGISSVGLYKDVVEGRISLGRSFVERFSKALGHNNSEARYFENMVFFNEAKTREERIFYFEQMMACSEAEIALIEADRYEYFSRWYYIAVRALLSYRKYRDCDEDHQKIANELDPPIEVGQAKKACSILQKLKLVEKDEKGYLILRDTIISTGKINDPEIDSLHVMNFQKTMIGNSKHAFNHLPSTVMDLSTLTLSISEETFKALKKDVADFRRKALFMAEHDDDADRVYQLNIQFFPVTKPKVPIE